MAFSALAVLSVGDRCPYKGGLPPTEGALYPFLPPLALVTTLLLVSLDWPILDISWDSVES